MGIERLFAVRCLRTYARATHSIKDNYNSTAASCPSCLCPSGCARNAGLADWGISGCGGCRHSRATGRIATFTARFKLGCRSLAQSLARSLALLTLLLLTTCVPAIAAAQAAIFLPPVQDFYYDPGQVFAISMPEVLGTSAGPGVYLLTPRPGSSLDGLVVQMGSTREPSITAPAGLPRGLYQFSYTGFRRNILGTINVATADFDIQIGQKVAFVAQVGEVHYEVDEPFEFSLPDLVNASSVSYAVSSDGGLPSGLQIAAGESSGSPPILRAPVGLARGSYEFSYVATEGDYAGLGEATQTFKLEVGQRFAFDTPAPDRYYNAWTGFSFYLPGPSNGEPVVYSLVGGFEAKPPYVGLSNEFLSNGEMLSGGMPRGIYPVAYTVTNFENQKLTQSFNLVIGGPWFSEKTSDLSLLVSEPVTLKLAQVNGGRPPLTFEVSGSASGMTAFYEEESQQWRYFGTPTGPSDADITIKVTDSWGRSDTLTFNVFTGEDKQPVFGVLSPVRFVTNMAPQEPVQLPEASGGNEPLQYSLSGTLPGSLIFDPRTRTLSGSLLSDSVGEYQVTYSVADGDDNTDVSDTDSQTITLEVVGDSAPSFADGLSPQSYVAGETMTPLQFPAATGGDYELFYSLQKRPDFSIGEISALPPTLQNGGGNPLPSYLSFDQSTLIMNGTFPDAGSFIFDYVVRDWDGDMAALILNVEVSANLAPSFAQAPADLTLLQGQALTPQTLPEATGGNGSLSYSLGDINGALPPGLSFSAARELQGTPSAMGLWQLVYRVVDDDWDLSDADSASLIFNITVLPDTSPTLPSLPDEVYTRNEPVSLQLPKATADFDEAVYSLKIYDENGENLLPEIPGLGFDAETRLVTGMPTALDTWLVEYGASDGQGDSSSVDFSIRVQARPVAEAGDNQTARGGETLLISGAGSTDADGDTLSFSWMQVAGPSVTLIGSTEAVASFSAPQEGGELEFQLVVNDGLVNSIADSVRVTVNPNHAPMLQGSIAARTMSINMQETFDVSAYFFDPDGDSLSYIVSSADATIVAAQISGTALTLRAVQEGTSTVTVTATDVVGLSAAQTFMAMVLADVAPTFGDTVPDQSADVGIVLSLSLPVATGGNGDLSYSLGDGDGNLPAGMLFDSSRRTFAGTPTQAGSWSLSYRASDSDDNVGDSDAAILTFDLLVRPDTAPAFSQTVGDQLYHLDHSVSLVLPAATGGNGALSYDIATLTLPPGLAFDPIMHSIAGTPTTEGRWQLAYRVQDADNNNAASDSASLSFRVDVERHTVEDPDVEPYFEEIVQHQAWLEGEPASLMLPEAKGGNGGLVYSLEAGAGSLPAGLQFNAGNRTLSGTPTVPGLWELDYVAGDSDANEEATDTSTLTFMLRVIEDSAPSFDSDLGNQQRLSNLPMELSLPLASGGNGALTYSLGDSKGALPTGLLYADGKLSGTPTEPGDWVLVLQAQDADSNLDASDAAQQIFLFRVVANSNPEFSGEIADQFYDLAESVLLLLPVPEGGDGVLRYSLEIFAEDQRTRVDSIPGLSFDAEHQILLGTTEASGRWYLEYVVEDAQDDYATAEFWLTVQTAPVADAGEDQRVPDGTTVSLDASASSDEDDNYANLGFQWIQTAGPTVTLLNAATDTPSFVAPADNAELSFMVTVDDGRGGLASDTVMVHVFVNNAPIIAANIEDIEMLIGDAVRLDMRDYFQDPDGNSLTWTALSADTGLVLAGMEGYNLAVGALAIGNTTVRVQASDGYEQAEQTVQVRVVQNAIPVFAVETASYYLQQGQALAALALPKATGGNGALVYAFDASSTLPTGLGLNAAQSMLTGVPTELGDWTLIYRVQDSDSDTSERDSDSVSLLLQVQLDTQPTLPEIADMEFVLGRDGLVTAPFPETTTGNAPFTYSMTTPSGEPLPGRGRLLFDPYIRILQGTVGDAGTYALRYRVVDLDGDEAYRDFNLILLENERPTLGDAGVFMQAFTKDVGIGEVQFPEADGGAPPLLYRLVGGDGLPPGLSFRGGDRILSGTPDEAGTWKLFYYVVDGNGDAAAGNLSILVQNRPVAEAGEDLKMRAEEEVSLDASASSDADGDILSYSWKQVSGTAVDLENSGDAVLRFTAPPENAELVFELVVSDNYVDSLPDQVRVSVSANRAPVAYNSSSYLRIPLGGSVAVALAPYFQDRDSESLSYSASSVDSQVVGAALGSDATLTLTGNSPGDAMVGIAASDSEFEALHIVNVQVYLDTPLLQGEIADQSYVVGTPVYPALQLPAAVGGDGELGYLLADSAGALPDGLEFDADSRELFGVPQTPGEHQMLYRVVDSDGREEDDVERSFMIRVRGLVTADAGADLEVMTGSMVTLDGGRSASLYREIQDYSWGQMAGTIVELDDANSRLLQFRAPNQEGTLVFELAVSDGINASLPDRVRVRVVRAQLRPEIMSQYALLLGDDISRAIAHRMEHLQAPAGSEPPVDESAPGGVAFSLPLTTRTLESGAGPGYKVGFWGRSSELSLSSEETDLQWQGRADNRHLGVDGRYTEHTVLGLMLSRFDSEFSYTDLFGFGGESAGQYTFGMVGVHPYVGWTRDRLALWGALGAARGTFNLEFLDDIAVVPSAASLRTAIFGASSLLRDGGWRLSFKSQASAAQLRVSGSNSIVGESVDNWRLLLSLQSAHRIATGAGAFLEPILDLGLRREGGDGRSEGIEAGLSLNYNSRAAGISIAAGSRKMIVARGSYEESGSYLRLQLDTDADGRGLALSLAPTEGDTSSGIDHLWQAQLGDLGDGEPVRARRLHSQISYGLVLAGKLWTPYGDFQWSDGEMLSGELGWQVQIGKSFNLRVAGETKWDHAQEGSHSVKLQGLVHF